MTSKRIAIGVALIAIISAFSFLYWWRADNNDMLNAMLLDTYGKYDAQKKVWRSDDSNIEYSICTQKEIEIRHEKHMLLALCGSTPEMDSHATPGSIDLYVLKGDRHKFTVAANLSDIQSGAYGQSGSVGTMKLGPQFYGFAIEEGWSGQGYTFATTTLYVPNDSELNAALTIRTGLDNAGTGECAEKKSACNDLERKLNVDESDANENVFPILVTQSGRYNGRSMSRTFKLHFDKTTWTYPAPKGVDLMPE